MSDPRDEELRRALWSGADEFVPAAPVGATRDAVVGRVRRRQRQVAALAVTATAMVVVVALLASGVGRSPGSSSRLVVAGGAGHTTDTKGATGATTPPTTGIVAGAGTGTGSGGTSSTVGPGGSHGTTTAPLPSTTGVTRPTTTTTPTTVPGGTTTTAPSSFGSAVQGNVLFGPTCPVERIPPDPACAPRPGPAHIQLLRPNGSVAAQGDAGSNGSFVIPVPPGTYQVAAMTLPSSGAIGRGCTASPSSVVVKAGVTDSVAVSCDTGIR